jgi:integrase/recombinase XerD
MKVRKITVGDAARIALYFPYETELIAKVKALPDIFWDKTLKCWHMPADKQHWNEFLHHFPDYGIITEEPVRTGIHMEVYAKQILLKMPKNDTDIQFVRSFKYVRWDRDRFCWIIPNYHKNVDLLKNYFDKRIETMKIHEQQQLQPDIQERKNNESSTTVGIKELLIVNYASRVYRLYYKYNRVLSQQLLKIPYAKWNSDKKCIEIPFADKLLFEVKSIAEEFKLQCIFREEKKQMIQPRKSRHDIQNYRECPQEYIDKLLEMRYSNHTLDVYSDLFEEFINYYEAVEIDEISESQITAFILYLVNVRKVSSSYQNQAINAIKFYYEKVKRGPRKIFYIDRPREEKILPEVLSEEEVASILQATDNLKHKAIMMTIYSAGLRISELINLKVKDIDSDRMQIRIEQSKGKKDRYTLLGKKLLDVLRNYVKTYKPKTILFEGSDGGYYSQRSIQIVLKKSAQKAGITKKISVHTLRHSFATHLLEAGTDIRYIQSLLGHESSKTTEIYTHITTKGFNQIVNPLDKLNLKE